MLVGGRLLSRAPGELLGGPLGAYTCSAALGGLAFVFALGASETLPRERRVPFSVRGSNPLGFLRLLRSGRLVGTLAAILALQTLHDGEGDVWQIYGTDVHGWNMRQNSLYGAAVGIATTMGGLLTGASVRAFGNRRHTLLWTLSTGLSLLLFASTPMLAWASVVFCAAEDCMSAAIVALLVQAGRAAGLSQGQLAGDVHNLSAIVRVIGLFLFGRLYLGGVHLRLPALPYLLCAGTQLAAAALVLAIPAAKWRSAASNERSNQQQSQTDRRCATDHAG
jgi:DHA1 family tetracycline resistance protein-like MFS transporter